MRQCTAVSCIALPLNDSICLGQGTSLKDCLLLVELYRTHDSSPDAFSVLLLAMDPISCIASGFALYQLLQSIKDLLDIGLAVKDASPKATALFKSLQLLADAISKVRDASNVVIFDEMSKGIFEACEEKALGLLGKVKDTISQLNSTSRRQRTWQAVKFTLERDETASLRQDIQDIQATLNLLLQSISM